MNRLVIKKIVQFLVMGFVAIGTALGLGPIFLKSEERQSANLRFPKGQTKSTAIRSIVDFLFGLFMTPEDCAAFNGDLEEAYTEIGSKFGTRRANIWYWREATTSLMAIAWAWVSKVFVKPLTSACPHEPSPKKH